MVRSSFITMPSMVGIVGCVPAEDEKVWFFCLFVCLSKFVITETLRSSFIFKTIVMSLHAGRFVVVHLYSTFSVDPHNFSLGANLYQKLPFFCDFGAVSQHFYSHNCEIWHEDTDLGLPPQAKLCKNHLRRYTPFGQIYTKNTNFGDFGGCTPTF